MAAAISSNIGAGQTYTTIQGWIDAQPNDPDASPAGVGTIVDASAFNETLTFDVPNANSCPLKLTASAGAMLDAPTWASATSNARLEPSAYQAGFTVSQPGWTIEKISVKPTTSGGQITIQANCTLQRCLFKALNQDTVTIATGSVTLTISNCVILGTDSGIVVGNGTMNAYHTSIVGCSIGMYRYGGTASSYGCITQATGSYGWFGTHGGDYNVSQDATAPGSSSTKYYRSTSGWFANTGSTTEDLSLAAGAQGKWVTDGKDAIDQTGWPSDVGTDIVGTTRAAPIDPGVWQTPAAGGGTTRGMPFGARSTAFNGGRTFAGVLR